MTATPWQYTDSTHAVVTRTWESGRTDAVMSSAQEIVDWVGEGHEILPEDHPVTELEMAATQKIAQLSAACEAHILAGFGSDALGEPHHYPFSERDQLNLHGAVLNAALNVQTPDWTTPLKCGDADEAWSYVMHTPAQTLAVNDDASAFRIAALMKNAQLAQCVAAATTIDEINAIGWDRGNEDCLSQQARHHTPSRTPRPVMAR